MKGFLRASGRMDCHRYWLLADVGKNGQGHSLSVERRQESGILGPLSDHEGQTPDPFRGRTGLESAGRLRPRLLPRLAMPSLVHVPYGIAWCHLVVLMKRPRANPRGSRLPGWSLAAKFSRVILQASAGLPGPAECAGRV